MDVLWLPPSDLDVIDNDVCSNAIKVDAEHANQIKSRVFWYSEDISVHNEVQQSVEYFLENANNV